MTTSEYRARIDAHRRQRESERSLARDTIASSRLLEREIHHSATLRTTQKESK